MFVQIANCLLLVPYTPVFHKAVFSDLCFFGFFSVNDPPLHIQDKKVRNPLFADDSTLNTSGKTVKDIEVTLQKNLPKCLAGV